MSARHARSAKLGGLSSAHTKGHLIRKQGSGLESNIISREQVGSLCTIVKIRGSSTGDYMTELLDCNEFCTLCTVDRPDAP